MWRKNYRPPTLQEIHASTDSLSLSELGILYSNLGYQSPFIASAILCGVDFLMRLVIIEPCHSPPEWFAADQDEESNGKEKEKEKMEIDEQYHGEEAEEAEEEPPVAVRVTTFQLLRHPRLIVSLFLTVIVATVMSAFEVKKNNKKHSRFSRSIFTFFFLSC